MENDNPPSEGTYFPDSEPIKPTQREEDLLTQLQLWEKTSALSPYVLGIGDNYQLEAQQEIARRHIV